MLPEGQQCLSGLDKFAWSSLAQIVCEGGPQNRRSHAQDLTDEVVGQGPSGGEHEPRPDQLDLCFVQAALNDATRKRLKKLGEVFAAHTPARLCEQTHIVEAPLFWLLFGKVAALRRAGPQDKQVEFGGSLLKDARDLAVRHLEVLPPQPEGDVVELPDVSPIADATERQQLFLGPECRRWLALTGGTRQARGQEAAPAPLADRSRRDLRIALGLR